MGFKGLYKFIYKLHKITNSPSPQQKYLVKHALYCFSLTGQAAKARQRLSGSKQRRDHVWCRAGHLAGRTESRQWAWSAADNSNSQPLASALLLFAKALLLGKPTDQFHLFFLLSYSAITYSIHPGHFALGCDVHKHLRTC